MSVTYHVVVPFYRIEGGDLVPGEAKEAPNREVVRRMAQWTPARCKGELAKVSIEIAIIDFLSCAMVVSISPLCCMEYKHQGAKALWGHASDKLRWI